MTMRTYWAWETAATLRLLGGELGAGVPTGGGEGWGISCRHVHSLFDHGLQTETRTDTLKFSGKKTIETGTELI